MERPLTGVQQEVGEGNQRKFDIAIAVVVAILIAIALKRFERIDTIRFLLCIAGGVHS